MGWGVGGDEARSASDPDEYSDSMLSHHNNFVCIASLIFRFLIFMCAKLGTGRYYSQ